MLERGAAVRDDFPRGFADQCCHLDALTGAINRELERMGVTSGHLTHSERLQVITSLESAGIFLLKGAIKSAAAALGCSTASIYRYLSQINPSD